jgi:two-component system nitrogen regulation response regulator GlnG
VNGVLLADVLVVADEEPVRTSVAQIERSAGYAVAEAVDRGDALDMLESWSVSVLFLDIRMPRRTGIEVPQALDAPPNVIPMSAYRFEGEDRRSVRNKVVSHQVKPVAPRPLLGEVRAAIDRETP